jgi:hypothetical protein
VTGNTIDNVSLPIALEAGTTSGLVSNNVLDNFYDEGILVDGGASLIQMNHLTGIEGGGPTNGIRVDGAGNTVSGNSVDATTVGIDVDGMDNVVIGNHAVANDIGLDALAPTTLVSRNVADLNGTGIQAPTFVAPGRDGGGNKARGNGILNCSPSVAC